MKKKIESCMLWRQLWRYHFYFCLLAPYPFITPGYSYKHGLKTPLRSILTCHVFGHSFSDPYRDFIERLWSKWANPIWIWDCSTVFTKKFLAGHLETGDCNNVCTVVYFHTFFEKLKRHVVETGAIVTMTILWSGREILKKCSLHTTCVVMHG